MATHGLTPDLPSLGECSSNTYSLWAFRAKTTFKRLGVWAVVETGLGEDAKDKDRTADGVAFEMLAKSLSLSDLPLGEAAASAHDLWTGLFERYGPKSAMSDLDLEDAFREYVFVPGSSFRAYYAEKERLFALVKTARKINNVGGSFDAEKSGLDRVFVREVLKGMRGAVGFDVQLSLLQTELRAGTLGAKRLYDMLAGQEEVLGMNASLDSGAVLAVSSVNGPRQQTDAIGQWTTCEVCCTNKHFWKRCLLLKCGACGAMGHHLDVCAGKERKEARKAMAGLVAGNVGAVIADTGADVSITNNKYLFSTPYIPVHRRICCANGTFGYAVGVGTMRLKCMVNGMERFLDIPETFYVPSAPCTLISMGNLEDNGVKWEHDEEGQAIVFRKAKTNEMLAVAPKRGGVYVLQGQVWSGVTAHAMDSHSSSLLLWHRRLGHVNVGALRELANRQAIDGLTPSDVKGSLRCDSCLAGKVSRLPYPRSETSYTEPLQLVVSDVVGPLPVEAIVTRRLYFVVFTDQATKYVVTFAMQSKSEVFYYFRRYKAWAERITGKMLKALHTDRGTRARQNPLQHIKQINYIFSESPDSG